jgi:hypothetical protein
MEDEMGGACSTCGGTFAEFGYGNVKEEEHLQNLGVDGRIILKWVLM